SNFAGGDLAGTVSFIGTGTVNAEGDLDFWNVKLLSGINAGVDFGLTGAPTINNELVINAGQWVDTNAPFYADGSTLVYNTGSEFVAGTEWYGVFDTDGRGIPHHVQIGRAGVDNSGLSFGAATSS